MSTKTHVVIAVVVTIVLIAVIGVSLRSKSAARQPAEPVKAPVAEVAPVTEAAPVTEVAAVAAAEEAVPEQPAEVEKAEPANVAKAPEYALGPEMVENPKFLNGGERWQYSQNCCSILEEDGVKFARIDNPKGKMIPIKQPFLVVSGAVYRISAKARSQKLSEDHGYFGASLAFYVPGSPEKRLVWLGECKDWTEKSLIFTNQYTGCATYYFHLGYCGEESCGDVTDLSCRAVKY